MYKGGLREDIETIVKVLPRPKMNGSLIVKKRNFWLIVQEYGEADGIILLNTVTNHEGPIPYDSIREFRKPDILILRAQVNLGRDGKFSMEPLSDGLDSEMQVEVEDILPERLVHAEIALNKCTEEQKITIRELLIRERMTKAEVQEFCRSKGFEKGHEFFGVANQLTSFLDRDDHHAAVFSMWIKPTFVPILEKLLLDSQKHKGFSSPHSQPGTAADS
jgi:hypothetical protein